MIGKRSFRVFLGISAVVAAICLIAALGLLYSVLNQSPLEAISRPAPDFSLPTLTEQSLSLEQLRGKPVLINFWAAWCEPCIAELPLLEATAQRHLGDLVVIGINEGDPLDDVEHLVKREAISYSILLDYDETVGSLYEISGYPTSIFIDAEGMIRAIYLGEIHPDQLERNLRLIGIE